MSYGFGMDQHKVGSWFRTKTWFLYVPTLCFQLNRNPIDFLTIASRKKKYFKYNVLYVNVICHRVVPDCSGYNLCKFEDKLKRQTNITLYKQEPG